eukprot:TRINITY_DN71633_c0_g1_i1.p1 TRINITY_DN71633_c0_g1~~TRINITY_DN71633_c0_g1_i1.p1  ORF type:complete len:402 (+),score=115.77 TRINITY_DN71633_c0_g1_i1:88-1206(+)
MATDEKVAQFQGVTGGTAEQAQHLLAACSGNVQQAISMFYETGGVPPQPAGGSAPSAPAAAPAAPAAAGRPAAGQKREMRISDLGGGEKGANEYFAGGGKDSGTAIIGPGGAGGPESGGDGVKSIFDDLKAQGGVNKADDRGGAGGAFGGAGYRLGATEGPAAGGQRPAPGTGAPVKERRCIITFWQNGFSVDDGPLQDQKSPEGQAFIADVRRGVIPQQLNQQLRQEYAGQALPELVIEVMDKTSQPYAPPPKMFKAFEGQGRSMRDSAPAPAAPVAPPAAGAGPQVPLPNVDEDKETTSVVAQLPDGTRLTVRLNVEHTVNHLRSFVQHSQPGMADFDLMTTFPRKVLTDMSATIAAAGLKKAVVVVKPK